jgi:peptide/nickel transport system substrate-binding protein
VSFKDKKSIPIKYVGLRDKLSSLFYEFSLFERMLVIIAAIVLVVSSFSSVVKLNQKFVVEIPKEGGEIKEGMIGTPRFINPVLATSDTDRDLSALLYSGLLRINSKGELVPDLAESYTISEDGLTYYFKIKEHAVFHDGTKVTTDDIIFTISKTQEPAIKSPKRPNWDGVRIEKINEREIEFTLSAPYVPFIYNTTLGILPKHKWQNITVEEFPFTSLNTNGIGSGPYEIKDIERDENEIITSYQLQGFSKYAIKKPYISKILISFYKSEQDIIIALNKKQVNSAHSISPKNIDELKLKNEVVVRLPYSRIFALFFNQNKSAPLTDKTIREALDHSIDRNALIQTTLLGYGTPLYSPLTLFSHEETTESYSLEEGKKILDGKDLSTATLKISTNNVPELIAVGESITNTFNELGIKTELQIHDINELTSTVIRPREYEAVLFGNVINRDLDYYAFWHSSQRNDPGLNLSSYTSIESDKALEEARNSADMSEKLSLLQKFEKEVINDTPAVFLYSPDFIYIVPQIVKAQFPQIIVTSSDRFADVYNWYIETETVWKIFAK